MLPAMERCWQRLPDFLRADENTACGSCGMTLVNSPFSGLGRRVRHGCGISPGARRVLPTGAERFGLFNRLGSSAATLVQWEQIAMPHHDPVKEVARANLAIGLTLVWAGAAACVVAACV